MLYGGEVITKSTEFDGISFSSLCNHHQRERRSRLWSYVSEIAIWRFAKSKVSFISILHLLATNPFNLLEVGKVADIHRDILNGAT